MLERVTAALRDIRHAGPSQGIIPGAGDSGNWSCPSQKDVLISWEQGMPKNKEWGGQEVLSPTCGRLREGQSQETQG